MTKKNSKKTAARARQAQFGGNYAHHRDIVEQAGAAAGPPESTGDPRLAVLTKFGFASTFGVVTGRSPTVASSASEAIALEHLRQKAANPTWFARDGHRESLISREESDTLIQLGAVGDERKIQIHRSFHAEHDPKMTFSARCKNCRSWIFLGDQEHEGTCRCGQAYRVVFDGPDNWNAPQGIVCVDCGTAFQLKDRTKLPASSPWRMVHEWQNQCAECAQKETSTDSLLKTRYPLHIGGATKYEKKDLSIINGDLAEDAGGDLALVGGADALGQQLERAVQKAKPITIADAEAAVKTCAQSKPLRDHIAEISAVRSSGKTIEVDFVAVGYPRKTQTISF